MHQASLPRLSAIALILAATLTNASLATEETPGAWTSGITVMPYGWFAELGGTLEGTPSEPDFPLPLSLDLDEDYGLLGLMLAGEVRGENWAVFADSVWVNVALTGDVELSSLLPESQFGADVDGNVYHIGVARRLRDFHRSSLSAYLAVRTYDIETKARVFDGLLPDALELSGEVNWSDAVLGIRVDHVFSSHWHGTFLLDAGVGHSDTTWQLAVAMSRDLGRAAITGGYRHLALDYSDEDMNLELELAGPFVGLAFEF